MRVEADARILGAEQGKASSSSLIVESVGVYILEGRANVVITSMGLAMATAADAEGAQEAAAAASAELASASSSAIISKTCTSSSIISVISTGTLEKEEEVKVSSVAEKPVDDTVAEQGQEGSSVTSILEGDTAIVLSSSTWCNTMASEKSMILISGDTSQSTLELLFAGVEVEATMGVEMVAVEEEAAAAARRWQTVRRAC